jgi:hypothetical protein
LVSDFDPINALIYGPPKRQDEKSLSKNTKILWVCNADRRFL